MDATKLRHRVEKAFALLDNATIDDLKDAAYHLRAEAVRS